ncbi:MAG: hypothetical protein WA364_22495 [Candidatus Nitrosopolaris sp.]
MFASVPLTVNQAHAVWGGWWGWHHPWWGWSDGTEAWMTAAGSSNYEHQKKE